MKSYDFSSERPDIEKYANILLIDNAQNLINYIYQNTTSDPYTNPEIRIGLAIKILLKTDNYFDIVVLQPIINDIEFLMNNEEYLAEFANPEERLQNLTNELILINKYKELSDTISLNKAIRN
jgi:hypothetical protein